MVMSMPVCLQCFLCFEGEAENPEKVLEEEK